MQVGHVCPLKTSTSIWQIHPKPSTGYGTTQTGYGTTSVWCKGGSRNVEGYWGFPSLKIKRGLRFLDFRFFVFLFCDLWFYCLLVLWFYSFMVLWYCGCVVLWFYGLWFYCCMVLWFMALCPYGFMALWFYGFTVL